MRDEVPGLGIVFLWQLPDTHPFQSAGLWHDAQYAAREAGTLSDETSARVDLEFYWKCLAIACEHHSLWLRAEAELFYSLVRPWGMLNWPEPKPKPPVLHVRQKRSQTRRSKAQKIQSKSQKARKTRRARPAKR